MVYSPRAVLGSSEVSCLVLGLAVTVGVTMYVLSISELSEVQMVGSSPEMRSQPMDVHVSSNKKR